MGRPRTIHVDRRKLLFAIAEEIIGDLADIDREIKALEATGDWQDRGKIQTLRYRDRPRLLWPEQNLSLWAGRSLTDSERIRHQQAIRQLESDGLIERDGRKLTLTVAGWRAAGLELPT